MNKGKTKLFQSLLMTTLALQAVTANGIKSVNHKAVPATDSKNHSIERRDRKLNSPFSFYAPYPIYTPTPLVSTQFQIPSPSPLNIYGPMMGSPLMNPMTAGMPIIDPKLMGFRMPPEGFPMMQNENEDNKKDGEKKDENDSKKTESNDTKQYQKYFQSIMSHSPFGGMMPFYQYNPYMPYSGSLYGNPFLMNPFHSVNMGYSFLNQPLNSLIITQNQMGGNFPGNQYPMMQQPYNDDQNLQFAEKSPQQADNNLPQKITPKEEQKSPQNLKESIEEKNSRPRERLLGIKKYEKIDLNILGSEDLIDSTANETRNEEESHKINL